jgi:hypothetical protein
MATFVKVVGLGRPAGMWTISQETLAGQYCFFRFREAGLRKLCISKPVFSVSSLVVGVMPMGLHRGEYPDAVALEIGCVARRFLRPIPEREGNVL